MTPSPTMRLFKKQDERRKSLWKKVVDLALTDVRVLAGGMDHESLEELEERLLAADFGVPATLRLVDHVEEQARRGKIRGQGQLKDRPPGGGGPDPGGCRRRRTGGEPRRGPTVYLVVGVNGVGKTTSIAKLAHFLVQQGSRSWWRRRTPTGPAPSEQLEEWARRAGADFVRGQEGGIRRPWPSTPWRPAIARGWTWSSWTPRGGSTRTRNLMEELRKVDRVIRRKLEGAPHETLIVLDATVGQNALAQVRAFGEAVTLTGIILAKMDSTARGGIVVALQEEHHLPVKMVGWGRRWRTWTPSTPRPSWTGSSRGGLMDSPPPPPRRPPARPPWGTPTSIARSSS
jgi:fused signal recognition particle receptor